MARTYGRISVLQWPRYERWFDSQSKTASFLHQFKLVNTDTLICTLNQKQAVVTVLFFKESQSWRVQNVGSCHSLLAVLHRPLLFIHPCWSISCSMKQDWFADSYETVVVVQLRLWINWTYSPVSNSADRLANCQLAGLLASNSTV